MYNVKCEEMVDRNPSFRGSVSGQQCSVVSGIYYYDIESKSYEWGGANYDDNYSGDEATDSVDLVFQKSRYMQHQWDFLTSGKSITGLVSGYAGGKTYVFLRRTLYHHLTALNAQGISRGIIVYPIYKQARSLFVEPFRELLRSIGVSSTYSSIDARIKTQYGIIDIHTMQRPERIVGEEYTYGGVDELDTVKYRVAEETVEKMLGRLRGNDKVILYAVTTPEGFRFTHHFFVEKMDETKLLIRARSTDNPFLSKDYLRSLVRQYDEARIKQYVGGEFVNLTGTKAVYRFDRDIHSKNFDIEEFGDGELWIGMDFNVNPMTAVATRVYKDYKGALERIVVVDEHILPNSNTRKTMELLERLYGDSIEGFVVDVSGNQRHTNAEYTDIQIIRDFGYEVFFRKILEKAKLDNLNMMFANNQILVHSNCKVVITDLENVVIGTDNKIDKKDQRLTHALDALGYLSYYQNAVIKRSFAK